MIEIPLSSVITQNQPNSEENESHNDTSSEPTLIGLGPLRTANKLWIKQRIRASDILSTLTGCEARDFYPFNSLSNHMTQTFFKISPENY